MHLDFQASYNFECQKRSTCVSLWPWPLGPTLQIISFEVPCTSTSVINYNLRKVEHGQLWVYGSIFNALKANAAEASENLLFCSEARKWNIDLKWAYRHSSRQKEHPPFGCWPFLTFYRFFKFSIKWPRTCFD